MVGKAIRQVLIGREDLPTTLFSRPDQICSQLSLYLLLRGDISRQTDPVRAGQKAEEEEDKLRHDLQQVPVGARPLHVDTGKGKRGHNSQQK